jgi:hypothetical protein
MTHVLINSKRQVINSEWNRPPYRGSSYPTFLQLLSAAMHYRAHGERVYVSTVRSISMTGYVKPA